MQRIGDNLVFSPSDPSGFTECLHLTRLHREVVEGRRPKAQGHSQFGNLIARKGDEHERAFSEHLSARGVAVAGIELGKRLD